MKIRQGNAFTVYWTVTVNGGVNNLSDLSNVSVELKNPIGQLYYPEFTVKDNTTLDIQITTKMEQWTGMYHLSCWVNKGTDDQAVVDSIDCFEIVDKAAKNIQDIEVTTIKNSCLHYCVGVGGLSAYEIAVANGFEGTELEWVNSLKKPAEEAAEKIDDLIEGVEEHISDKVDEKLQDYDFGGYVKKDEYEEHVRRFEVIENEFIEINELVTSI